MVRPSRRMPQFVPMPVKWWRRLIGYAYLTFLACGCAQLVREWPIATLAMSLWLVLLLIVDNHRLRFHLRALSDSRVGESICTFMRAFSIRELDTWVVRAVFEQVQGHLRSSCARFPLRPSDHLFKDLKIDPEDLDMYLVREMAQRSGRSLYDCLANPYYGRVATVHDLIRFLCAQPKRAT